MKKIFLFIFTLCISLGVSSQDHHIEIIGEIIDAEKKEAVPYVHIVNEQLKLGTVSNTAGRFWIKMQREDTLMFSAIGFENYIFTLKGDVTTDKLMVTIELNLSTMELQPVKVFAYRNEEALKQALLDTKVPLEEQQRGIQLPGFYYGPKKEVKISPFGNPLSFIASKFSREEKEKKMVARYQKQVDYQKQIRAKYNQSVVLELTGLPEDEIEDFMNFCKLNDSFLGPASEYEIAIAVNKCLVDFKSTTPLDSLPQKQDQ